jgi:hypothetical protein
MACLFIVSRGQWRDTIESLTVSTFSRFSRIRSKILLATQEKIAVFIDS